MSEEQNDKLITEIQNHLPAVVEPIQRRAINSIISFVGGGAAYISAWMRRPRQAVDDITEARSYVSKIIAQEVADNLKSDPEIIASATAKMAPSFLRKEVNKLQVAEATIENLKNQSHDDINIDNNQNLDEDWLNNFERFAEDASTEKMQNLWGQVLAGEIRAPGSFSRSTLRFLYELESSTAQDFEKVKKHIINDQVFIENTDDKFFQLTVNLNSIGIITGVGGLMQWGGKFNHEGYFLLLGRQYGMIIYGKPQEKIHFEALPLTQIGKELLNILPNTDEYSKLKNISQLLQNRKNTNIFGAAIGPVVSVNGKDYGLSKTLPIDWGNKSE